MNSHEHATQLTQFREQVYQNFNKRADASMDLLDALSSNSRARSVVELSLEACFRREHTSVFKAIAAYCPEWMSKSLARLARPYLPEPHRRSFWLLAMDTTPQSRPYAQTMQDRSYVYHPTPIQSNKPVTLGHCYSEVVLLPEREVQAGSAWAIPLSTQRVSSTEDKELVGAIQVNTLLDNPDLPFHGRLCVEVGDTSYSKPKYLFANRPHSNLVTLVRVRSTRTFYRKAALSSPHTSRGHPRWYGTPFCLRDPQTWAVPDETTSTSLTSHRGQVYQVEIEAWHDLLMRGKRKPINIPMHRYPFTLLRIRLYNAKGELAYSTPLWLLVMGEKRIALSLLDSHSAYNQRFDVEHFIRFGKQRLILDGFQTPDLQHEENWWSLAHLAYLQLWVARPYAENHPHPWERRTSPASMPSLSPTRVQRDFGRIIRQIGTPATIPKRRGYSPGRRKGIVLARRPRLPPVFKGLP
jgi:hypothetical protein